MSTWNGKYVSLKHVINKVQRDTKNIINLDISDAVEWAGEAMELIKAPLLLLDKVESVKIENYKGKLPCDLFMIRGVRVKDGLPLRYSSDIYHNKIDKCVENHHCHPCHDDHTYTINDDYIFTRFECDCIEISYRAMPTDENGWPIIPDDIKFVQAVKSYIIERLFYGGNLSGKITEVQYERALKDRYWYIAAAQNRGNLPSYDQMESIKNNLIRLIPKINHHSTGFASADDPEMRYSQNSYSTRDYTNIDDSRTIPFYFYTG